MLTATLPCGEDDDTPHRFDATSCLTAPTPPVPPLRLAAGTDREDGPHGGDVYVLRLCDVPTAILVVDVTPGGSVAYRNLRAQSHGIDTRADFLAAHVYAGRLACDDDATPDME